MNGAGLLSVISEIILSLVVSIANRIKRADNAAPQKNDPRLSLVLARDMAQSAQITRLSQVIKCYQKRIVELERKVRRLEGELAHLKNELAHFKNERF